MYDADATFPLRLYASRVHEEGGACEIETRMTSPSPIAELHALTEWTSQQWSFMAWYIDKYMAFKAPDGTNLTILPSATF